MKNLNAETLHSVIEYMCLPGSIIITNDWRGYLGIETFCYDHLTVNHSKEWVIIETDAHINNIKGTCSALKAFCQVGENEDTGQR